MPQVGESIGLGAGSIGLGAGSIPQNEVFIGSAAGSIPLRGPLILSEVATKGSRRAWSRVAISQEGVEREMARGCDACRGRLARQGAVPAARERAGGASTSGRTLRVSVLEGSRTRCLPVGGLPGMERCLRRGHGLASVTLVVVRLCFPGGLCSVSRRSGDRLLRQSFAGSVGSTGNLPIFDWQHY